MPKDLTVPPLDFQLEKVKLEITITAEVVFPSRTDSETMRQWALDRVSLASSLASCVRKMHVRHFPVGVVSS